MLTPDQPAPPFAGYTPGQPTLIVFFETDCPTCQLALPYVNKLSGSAVKIIGISQDNDAPTREFVRQLGITFPVELDRGLNISRAYDPRSVPAFFLVGADGQVQQALEGFDKALLNDLAAAAGHAPIASEHDGAPAFKPGCSSRHLEPESPEGHGSEAAGFLRVTAEPASRLSVPEGADPFAFCMERFGDALPVIPPTEERVQALVKACGLPPQQIIARIPPVYGEASVEKIAANAVMAGCAPPMMRVLLPLIRAVCDERFNIHGVQATTHFAAPLVIVNGPVRAELGFWSRQNVFSNVARANSTLGRALQLILLNIGGGRPTGIDMSALGNPGKFSYCIAENEEESPWEPLHVARGLRREQSAVTVFAGEPPHGVSEHNAARGKTVLKAVCHALATVWSYRLCTTHEAVVVLCPEHVKTLHHDGFTREHVRQYLFENTGIPVRHYQNQDDRGEGLQLVPHYREITIDGERCYQKFRSPESLHIVVAGGTAGKFSAVIGSWATGPMGSQMVTYPVE